MRTLMIAMLLLVPALALAQSGGSGVQLCPDGERVLVSKDVGDERWSMMYDLRDHSVMGNVFFASGGPPAFVWCERTASDGNPDARHEMMTFSCYGADTCEAEPCAVGDWHAIGDVTLPGEFFMAPMGPGMMGGGPHGQP